MPRVLLLIPTISYKSTDFLIAAEKIGADVIVASNECQALEDIVPGHTLTLDFLNLEESVSKVVSFSKKIPIDAVVSTDEDALALSVRISEALGLPHNSIDSIKNTQDKSLLRRILTKADIPTAKADCYSISDSAEEIAERVHYPCVLKPIHLSASRGVIRADTPQAFQEAFCRITKILSDPEVKRRGQASARKILVEQFIPGEEVAVEGLLQNGQLTVLAIFDKPDPLNGPFFEETIYVTPSRLSASIQEEIADCTEKGCAAIGLKAGPVHAELRINEKGAFIIEIAARTIGGICSRTLRFGLGVSLEEIMLQHAVATATPRMTAPVGRGENTNTVIPIENLKIQSGASGVMMIPIPKAGILADITGVEEAKKLPLIEGIHIMIRRKQKVIPLPEGRRYFGFIFARGETPEAVETALRKAHQTIKLTIVP
ncbi:MAG: ATP-grasp domain-containing protein [Nitrospirota bacterium]